MPARMLEKTTNTFQGLPGSSLQYVSCRRVQNQTAKEVHTTERCAKEISAYQQGCSFARSQLPTSCTCA
jgi:hypothetical protein